MTVRELIDKLWTLPPDAEVKSADDLPVYVAPAKWWINQDELVVYITDINPEDK